MPRILDMVLATRPQIVILACVMLTLPLLGVTIPPLTDVPGHMGSSAAAAYGDDPVFARLMAYHWHLVPNLGADVIVAAIQGPLGITRAYWLVAVIIPVLLAAGILAIARTLNPRGAAATPWALIFVYSFPFNNGFLNYMLGVGLSLLGFASWMRLDHRPRIREAAAWIGVPIVFLCHAVSGCLLVLFIGMRELDLAWRHRRLGTLLHRIRPLLSSVVIILAWRLSTNSFTGRNRISVGAKLDALVMLLRDQSLLLDVGSLILAVAVFVLGYRRGARPHHAVRPTILILCLLFLVTPSLLSGSSYADERLLLLIPMLAFATQDYSAVDRRFACLIAYSGVALLIVRILVTSVGFGSYEARYMVELHVLAHIPEHSRVLVLNNRDCSAIRHWRSNRLDHLGELAIVGRRSWTNSEWDTDGGHLLQVRYRPSPFFYDDPSQYVWPSGCGGIPRRHPTMQDALANLPLDGIDYLWLLDATLPSGTRNPRLAARWHEGSSTLYAVLPSAGTPGRQP